MNMKKIKESPLLATVSSYLDLNLSISLVLWFSWYTEPALYTVAYHVRAINESSLNDTFILIPLHRTLFNVARKVDKGSGTGLS
jgi:hypothetical protein